MGEVQTVTGPSPEIEQPAVYEDIYQVPVHLRSYKSAKLSLAQINNIVADAYAYKIESGDTFVPDFGGAKKRFSEGHEILNSFWVERKEKG